MSLNLIYFYIIILDFSCLLVTVYYNSEKSGHHYLLCDYFIVQSQEYKAHAFSFADSNQLWDFLSHDIYFHPFQWDYFIMLQYC
jgi:hypothetical protein